MKYNHKNERVLLALAAAAVLAMPVSVSADPAAELPIESMETGDVSGSGYLPVYTEGTQFGEGDASLRRAYTLPRSYDLRQKGGVTSVKNQRDASLCWAYSAIASAESGLVMDGTADESLDLSENHLGWAAYNGEGETFAADSGENWITNGGNRYYSTGTLSRWYGAEMESRVGNNPNASNRGNSISHLENVYYLPEFNIYTVSNGRQIHDSYRESARDVVKRTIMEQGAVEAGIRITGEQPDAAGTYYCDDSSMCTPDHSVALIGWDDDRVTSAPEPGAWLMKNSWGEESGADGGYYWVSYYDKSLDNPTFYEFEDTVSGNHDYKNIYQYDGTGGGTTRYYDSEKLTGANVFTAERRESIGEIGFYVMHADTRYTIEIYTELTGNTPDTGTCVQRVTGKQTYAGYYTVPLNETVTVEKGAKFAVAVTMVSDGEYSVPTEWDSSGAKKITVGQGESFVQTGAGWTDVLQINGGKQSCNICIKAFGNDAPPKPKPAPQPAGWWVHNGTGWWYDNGDGTWPANCWKVINGTWYVFDSNGYMQTGWFLDGSTWYYLNDSGAMVTGWYFDGSTWYYLNGNGAMATGWQYIGNVWYYLNGNGAMATGWQYIGNVWYYLNGNGAMATGWYFDGSTWYYLNESGAMATGWQYIGNVWYYLYDSGAMAADTWIGQYYVNGSGAWV